METIEQAQSTETVKKTQVKLGDFGNGRFSPAMEELYKDSQRLLGFSQYQAHVTALRIGVDAGQLMNSPVKLAYGKSLSKDGKRTLKEVVKGVKCTNSWAMSIGAICSQLDEARANGLEVVECTVNDHLLSFVNEAASKIEASAK